jgi:hypothetical protein
MIVAEDDAFLVLDSVNKFASTSVILVGGSNTCYTCSYGNEHFSILNITSSKSFVMKGGILKYGFTPSNSDYYFMWVSGVDGPWLNIWSVEIQFVSLMNSFIYVEGGIVVLEDVKVNDQLDMMWTYPLVDVCQNVSDVIVELHSCSFTNNKYQFGGLVEPYKSAVVYFVSANYGTDATKQITLNMSFCFFDNNTFNLSFAGNMYNHGGVGHIYSRNSSSSFFFSFSFFFFFFFCYFYFVFLY